MVGTCAAGRKGAALKMMHGRGKKKQTNRILGKPETLLKGH